MTAFTTISGAAAAIRTRITTNAATLGGVKDVLDRDEDPAILADNPALLPVVCVIPLGDEPDSIHFSMGSNDWAHELTIRVVGYYQFSKDNKDPFADLATVRQYAYDTLELFRGPTLAGFYPGCNITDATLELGYYITSDMVIHRYDIGLRVKVYESV